MSNDQLVLQILHFASSGDHIGCRYVFEASLITADKAPDWRQLSSTGIRSDALLRRQINPFHGAGIPWHVASVEARE
jgi:hypothetical protein